MSLSWRTLYEQMHGLHFPYPCLYLLWSDAYILGGGPLHVQSPLEVPANGPIVRIMPFGVVKIVIILV